MIRVELQPPEIFVDQPNDLTVNISNHGSGACANIVLKITLPGSLLRIQGSDRVELSRLGPGETVTHKLVVHPRTTGSLVVSSANFSYRDASGQTHREGDLRLPLTVAPGRPPEPRPACPGAGQGRPARTSATPAASSPARRHGSTVAGSRAKIFVSYSHQDKEWLERLHSHLKPYGQTNRLDLWDDTMLQAGDRWLEEIKKALATAKVMVPLVSPNFLASDFIQSQEVPPMLNATRAAGMRLLWVPLRHSAYKETFLAQYQALVNPQKPLATLPDYEVDQVLVKVCEQITRAASS